MNRLEHNHHMKVYLIRNHQSGRTGESPTDSAINQYKTKTSLLWLQEPKTGVKLLWFTVFLGLYLHNTSLLERQFMPGTDNASRRQKTAGGSCLPLQWHVLCGTSEYSFNLHLSRRKSALKVLVVHLGATHKTPDRGIRQKSHLKRTPPVH